MLWKLSWVIGVKLYGYLLFCYIIYLFYIDWKYVDITFCYNLLKWTTLVINYYN